MELSIREDYTSMEDLLASDDLFVEYFNAFLALPTFPEPLCFNKETSGFEVLGDGKKQLSNQIKAAIRSSKRPKRIYQVTKNHSYSPIPLIPMEDEPYEEVQEIETSFMVKTLNKEQGISFVKQHRLPTFLESDIYLEYRLAKLISQAHISSNPRELVTMKIDYTPRPKKVEKEEEPPPPDPTEMIMKNCYVCLGNSGTTETQAWVQQAKIAHDFSPTMTTGTRASSSVSEARPVSGRVRGYGPRSGRPKSSRPRSAFSNSGISTRSDSGFGSNCTSRSMIDIYSQEKHTPVYFDMNEYTNNLGSFDSERLKNDRGDNSDNYKSELLKSRSKPVMPRPSDFVCVLSEDAVIGGHYRGSGVVYTENKASGNVSGSKETKERDNRGERGKTMDSGLDSLYVADGSLGKESKTILDLHNSNQDIQAMSLEELSVVITGVVIRRAIEELLQSEMEDSYAKNEELNSSYNEELTSSQIEKNVNDNHQDKTAGSLQNHVPFSGKTDKPQCDNTGTNDTRISDGLVSVKPQNHVPLSGKTDKPQCDNTGTNDTRISDGRDSIKPQNHVPLSGKTDKPPSCDNKVTNNTRVSDGLDAVKPHLKGEMKGEVKGAESDEDSLLNSDDDYEERDSFFRRHKPEEQVHSLLNKKGIDMFVKFLKGTIGERNWHLWLDIDRGKMNKESTSWQNYCSMLREKYHNHGALYELNQAVKQSLGLVEPSAWTIQKLFSVQNTIAEPLVLYWAPRFLLKQQTRCFPERNLLYQNQQILRPSTTCSSYPDPPTIALLPLRPKTCAPRLRSQESATKHNHHTGKVLNSPRENNHKIRQSSAWIKPLFQDNEVTQTTTPPTGMKRNYNLQKTDSKDVKKNVTIKKNENKKKIQRQLAEDVAKSVSSHKKSTKVRPCTAPVQRVKKSLGPVDSAAAVIGDNVRRSSASSECSSEASSVFAGGRRMEALLQALYSERKAGGIFEKYIDRQRNRLWKNCLHFWEELQDYHMLFYDDILDPYLLDKKAKHIYVQFITETAPSNIQCSRQIQTNISKHLKPPFEELFDYAEEYTLEILFQAWSQMLMSDFAFYDKIELVDVKRKIETKSKYVMNLQRRGLMKERSLSQESAMEGYQDPVYDETLLEKIPEQFREYTLDKLVHNRMEIEHFKTFLSENFADMDLMCWMDIEAFRRITHTEQRRRDMKAKDIRLKYLNKKYFFGATSPAGKEGQDKVMEAGGGWGKLLDDRPPTGLLLEAQKYVASRLEKKWLPMFLATEEFCERQNPRSSLGDVAEDLLLMKRRKSTQVWKILESRWVSSSKDIISFRKALLNPVTCLQFRRYVSIKGDSLENDVLFWQEVQRYKTLCHANSDRSLINQKVAAIINTFIDSQIPPALQIDIPSEQAEKIIEKRLEAAPYIFREAQLTVFRVLFSHWSEFCTYRANLAEDRILPTIERQRRRAKQKEKEQQRKMQAQHEKEMARRRAAGLPTGGKDDDEDDYNPFKDLTREDGEESDSEMRNNKEGVMWTYSQYVNTLVEENNTNTADERTLSSLADTESMKDVKNDYEPEESQLKPVANGTKTDKKKQADSKIQKKSDRRIQIQQPPFEKAKILDTERGKGVERGRKTKEKTAQDKKIDPTQTKTETASKKTAPTHSTARGMPPLVKKR